MTDIEIMTNALESSLQGIKRDINECDKVYLHIGKALFSFNQLKQALQEKAEREKGCEYCYDEENKQYIKALGNNYCFNCGRKLEE